MKIHIVKKGDTLFELSKKYNVPLQKLIEANPQIVNPEQLNLGDKVKIPAAAVPVEGEGFNVYKHVVKSGDSLWKLAKAWGLSLQTLIGANPQLGDPNDLKVGDVINIPSGGSQSSSPAGQDNSNKPPVVSGAAGKKNTAPIKEVKKEEKVENVEKAEETKPIPAPAPAPNVEPAPAPAPAPSALSETVPVPPINVEPPKQPVPMPTPVQVEIGVEHISYEPIFYENINIQPVQSKEPPCPPKPEYPVLPSPYNYQLEQPTFTAPAQVYPSSPCGCHGSVPKHENEHLFHQYPVEAEKAFANYDYPHSMEHLMPSQHVYSGEYPGISNAPMYLAPDNIGPEVGSYAVGDNMEKPWENNMHHDNMYHDNMYHNNMHHTHEPAWQQPWSGYHPPVNAPFTHEAPGGIQPYSWPAPYIPSTCCGPQPLYHQAYYPTGENYPHMMPMSEPHYPVSPYGISEMPGQGMHGKYDMYGMKGMTGLHGMPEIPNQPHVPVAPLGGFGATVPGYFDREANAPSDPETDHAWEANATTSQANDSSETAKTRTREKAKTKKDAKISGRTIPGKTNGSKRRASGSIKKKSNSEIRGAKSELRNPWING